MSFEDVWGQAPAVQTLTRALQSDHVHHAYRFEGPPGVGKEMTALRLARALVCPQGELGCGSCSACRRALAFSSDEPQVPQHPDVVLVGRGIYRSVTGQAEATGIGIDQIRRVVLTRIGFPPHEGHSLVFIVRDADELTPPAANALLKTLEEPPSRTRFVLLTSRPNRLLDTIRSRTLPVRFGALADAVLERILAARGLPTERVALAQGSADLAVELASGEAVRERERFSDEALAVLGAPDFVPALRLAESRKGDRESVKADLGFLAQRLALHARESIRTQPREAEQSARRHRVVLAAMDDVEHNVQPALALESLLLRLRDA